MGSIAPSQRLLRTGRSLVVRSVSADDAQQLIAHQRSIIEEAMFTVTTPDEFRVTDAEEEAWIRDHLDDPAKLALVADIDGEIIGLLDFKPHSRVRLAHVGAFGIGVRQGWRGCGIGTALLEALLEWAKNAPGIEKVGLAALSSNATALRLYRRFGFTEEGRRIREIKIGPGQYVDDVLMYRWVKEPAS